MACRAREIGGVGFRSRLGGRGMELAAIRGARLQAVGNR